MPKPTTIVLLLALVLVGIAQYMLFYSNFRMGGKIELAEKNCPPCPEMESKLKGEELKTVKTPQTILSEDEEVGNVIKSMMIAAKSRITSLEEQLSKCVGRSPTDVRLCGFQPFVATERRCEINAATPMCASLKKLAQQEDVNIILEIGTYLGWGGAHCVATAIQEHNLEKQVIGLEFNQEYFVESLKNVVDLPIRMVLGSTVPASGFESTSDIPTLYKTGDFSTKYDEDVLRASKTEPLLEAICKNSQIDLVIHDGGDYAIPAEFKIIDTICKPRYLAFKGEYQPPPQGMNPYRADKMISLLSEQTSWAIHDSGNYSGYDFFPWWIYKRL